MPKTSRLLGVIAVSQWTMAKILGQGVKYASSVYALTETLDQGV